LAAEEARTEANIIIENSPDQEMVQEAIDAATAASLAISDARAAQQKAIEAGAEPFTYEVTEGGDVIGFYLLEPEIDDEEPASRI
ncbi:hypothetical protein ACFL1N_13605, partial [Thermodesulfobacteriota bacterium]